MYSIALIGAGPIGIEMAVALKRAGVNYVHLEAGALANTIGNYPEETSFFSSPERIEIAGYPLETYPKLKATKEQYLSYLRGVCRAENLQISLYSKVVRIDGTSPFELKISRLLESPSFGKLSEPRHAEVEERSIKAEKIILAIGDMHRPNLLGISGEDLPHVHHVLQDPHSYFGCSVLIVGGKNSAAEAALRLARLGVNVYLSYRKAQLDVAKIKPWILPDLKSLIRSGRIIFLPESEVVEITSDSAVLHNDEGRKVTLKVDKVVVLTGYLQSSELFNSLGVKLIEREVDSRFFRPEFNAETLEAVPGVFIIGTAVAGSQVSKTSEYIETAHVHISKVLATLGIECLIPIQDLSPRPLEEREL